MYGMEDIIGKEIKIISMAGEQSYDGKKGIVCRIDDMGQLHGSWGGLAVNPQEDKFEILS